MSRYGIESTVKDVLITTSINARKLRKSKKLTQRELSEKSGVAYATVKKFELTGIISYQSLLLIADALSSLDDFTQLFIASNLEDNRHLFEL